jgi:hypothetical protein
MTDPRQSGPAGPSRFDDVVSVRPSALGRHLVGSVRASTDDIATV